MYITVEDFMDLCVSPILCKAEIFDLETGKTLWQGNGNGIPEEYLCQTVESFDPPDGEKLTLNICYED